MKLFTVSTVTESLHGYKDVTISFFVDKRAQPLFEPRGYHDVIEDYDPDEGDRLAADPGDREFLDGYEPEDTYHGTTCAEMAIEELFTEAEAQALAAWLRVQRGATAVIKEVKLPIAANSAGLGAMPCGGSVDNLMIGEADDYDLPFEACGYFDVRECEFDATLPGARRMLHGVVIRDGKVEPWFLEDEVSARQC